jgi:hypothetical protein
LHAFEHIHVGKRIARNSNTAPAKANRFIAVPCANRG